jgi:hypothetical protein
MKQDVDIQLAAQRALEAANPIPEILGAVKL